MKKDSKIDGIWLGVQRRRQSVFKRGLAAALLVLTAATGCSPGNETPPSEVHDDNTNAEKSGPQRPNVLMIVLDALPASRLSLYGNPAPTTPNIDALAARGAYFTNAHSQATNTLPSTWSYFTGRYPYLPGSYQNLQKIRPADATLPALLGLAGYRTGYFGENPFMTPSFGYDNPFDHYLQHEFRKPVEKEEPAETELERLVQFRKRYFRDTVSSETITEKAIEWFSSRDATQPWFCYVHYLRPHTPYYLEGPYLSRFVDVQPPDGQSLQEYLKDIELWMNIRNFEQLRNPGMIHTENEKDTRALTQMFDANLNYTDELTGRLLDALREHSLDENTIVVILSDHGEAFGEHGGWQHSREPWQELIHVPLIVAAPDTYDWRKGAIAEYTELVDLTPTLLEALYIATESEMDGHSLVPLLTNQAISLPREVGVAEGFPWNTLAVRKDNVKGIFWLNESRTGFERTAIFDLDADPNELNDLSASHSARSKLEALALRYLATQEGGEHLSRAAVPEETIEALESLGYIVGNEEE